MLSLVAALAVAACGSSNSSSSSSSSAPAGTTSSAAAPTSSSSSGTTPAKSGGTITLGTKNFTEEYIVGALYQQALTKAGCKVNYKPNIGATEVVDKALTSGQIDAYPEYTGESVATVFDINKTVTSPQEEYNLAKTAYAKRGQVMSAMTPFFDTDAIAVLKSYAQKYHLVNTADLAKVPHFTLGARPEFLSREEGAEGMKKVYGVKNFTFKSLALGLQYQALDSGAVNAIDVFTTDPQLASGKYTVLKDPKNIFGFQNIALIINKNKLSGCPQALSVADKVNKLLTTPAIIAMNKAVALDKQQPGPVAASFLKANGMG
ncbi:MAG TPA: glycine betaine ABC transporter substrate-binding protein [Solirubrobacteraceae bacterium]|jgi:osmoprotectant transport system substrate-binding protein|nr:glycine betaine ABC transporter substrate-binding protein [Solirubrobacteraceae bacterium]